jgi:hypothetical protein
MIVLIVGMQVFHNGIPVELLYRVKPNEWMVKPLFVEGKDHLETFKPQDRCSFLHTTRVRRASA